MLADSVNKTGFRCKMQLLHSHILRESCSIHIKFSPSLGSIFSCLPWPGEGRIWPRPVLLLSWSLLRLFLAALNGTNPPNPPSAVLGLIQPYSEWLMITANTCRQDSGRKRPPWVSWGGFRMHQKEGTGQKWGPLEKPTLGTPS